MSQNMELLRGFACLSLLLVDLFPLFSAPNSGLRPNIPGYDNGAVINQMASESQVVYLPEGTYYFSTPISFDNCRNISIDGDLIYNGTRGKTAITIKGNNVLFNLNGSLSYGNAQQFLEETDNNTTIGLNFININNSKVYINEVKFFNENIRLSGIGAGCSYNKFSFGIVRNCLVGLRIFQEDKDGKRGWVNENSFFGGRFTNFSDWKFRDRSVAIRIAGSETSKDSYNSSNSNFFMKQSFEGFNTVVQAKNIRNCDFLYARLEGSKVFVKFIGECRECRVSYDVASESKLYDDSESRWIPIRVDECSFSEFLSIDFANPRIVNNSTGDIMAFYDACGFLDRNTSSSDLRLYSSITNYSSFSLDGIPAVNISSAGGRVFKISSQSKLRIRIYYLTDAHSQQIKKSGLFSAPLSLLKSSFSTTSLSGRVAYVSSLVDGHLFFCVPETVGTIQIAFENPSERVSISSTGPVPVSEYPKVSLSGSSSSRPKYGYVGQFYYDTTLESYLYWDGKAWRVI